MFTAALNTKPGLPRQIPYIIGNEGCERFTFYGMRNILTPFLVTLLAAVRARKPSVREDAKEVFHTFVIGVYFFPLLGGWIADRFLGKYRTILWLSASSTASGTRASPCSTTTRTGFYTGLFLIALGSGGIKPLRRGVRRRPVRPDATSTSPRSCSTPSTGSSTSARSSRRC